MGWRVFFWLSGIWQPICCLPVCPSVCLTKLVLCRLKYFMQLIHIWHFHRPYHRLLDPLSDTAKLTGPRTFVDKRWLGPVKLLCIIMFIWAKSGQNHASVRYKPKSFRSVCTMWLWTLTSPMTLTLKFWIFKSKFYSNYFWNGWSDWFEIKGIWIDRMILVLCNLDFGPYPWPLKCMVKIFILHMLNQTVVGTLEKKMLAFLLWHSILCFIKTVPTWLLWRVNSLWPSDTIWRQSSESTLAQVMACCLMAPSHYLNQCSLIISKVQWHLSVGNFTIDTSAMNHLN